MTLFLFKVAENENSRALFHLKELLRKLVAQSQPEGLTGDLLPNWSLTAGSGKCWGNYSSQTILLLLLVNMYLMQSICSCHFSHLEDLVIPTLNVLKKNWVGTQLA